MIEKTAFDRWPNCWRLANGEVEPVVPLHHGIELGALTYTEIDARVAPLV
jgi:hypothetical protein